jgi:hypothetical protein
VIRLTVFAFTVSAACPDTSRSLLLSVGGSAYRIANHSWCGCRGVLITRRGQGHRHGPSRFGMAEGNASVLRQIAVVMPGDKQR